MRTHDPVLDYLVTLLRQRLILLHRDHGQGGYSTEAVLVIGLLVAGALVAVGYILMKVKAAAQSIQIQ